MIAIIAALCGWPGFAQPLDHPAAALAAGDREPAGITDTRAGTVFLNNRKIVTFRATLLGDSPSERAELTRAAVEAAVARKGQGQVTRTTAGDSVRFDIDGATVFFLVAADLTGPRPGAMLDAVSRDVERRLRLAIHEAKEIRDPRQIAVGAAYAAAATAIAFLLARMLLAMRRRAVARMDAWLQNWQAKHPVTAILGTYAEHAQSGVRLATTVVTWGLVLLLTDLWATFVLRQFAYTRPWGERATAWLLELLEQFALATAGAVPGLLTAVLIFAIARFASRAGTLFMERVERGEIRVGWLDRDTAGPTRRLGNLVIWMFALAMAYPYLPGADSEAFKGVSVLAGLMLSLGASSVVGQAMSGLSLMYSRSVRVGEYVKIGDTEGTVTAVGMFATRVHTGLGEEVSIPSTIIFSHPIRNFSRLVPDGRFVLHTAVTIGYSTPWRQVHAMLLEAARRTPGVSREPAPYVVQTALSDFYVEYRLCAQSNNDAPRRRAEAMNQLHANIQDVFNENGVQIMSPHYMADPPQPQVVPPADWSPELARPGVRKSDPPSPPNPPGSPSDSR